MVINAGVTQLLVHMEELTILSVICLVAEITWHTVELDLETWYTMSSISIERVKLKLKKLNLRLIASLMTTKKSNSLTAQIWEGTKRMIPAIKLA